MSRRAFPRALGLGAALLWVLSGAPRAAHKPAGAFLIEEVVASNQAAVEFKRGIGAPYKIYVIEYFGVEAATDDVCLRLRVSTDGGSTWKSGASDYSHHSFFQEVFDGEFWKVDTADSAIDLWGDSVAQGGWGLGNAAGEEASGWIRIHDPANAGRHTSARFAGTHADPSGGTVHSKGAGRYLATTAVDGFQLFLNSGNISAGTFRLYGIR